MRLDALEGGTQDGTLRIVDPHDGLILETVPLTGDVKMLP